MSDVIFSRSHRARQNFCDSTARIITLAAVVTKRRVTSLPMNVAMPSLVAKVAAIHSVQGIRWRVIKGFAGILASRRAIKVLTIIQSISSIITQYMMV